MVLVVEAGARHEPTPEVDIPGGVPVVKQSLSTNDQCHVGYMGRTIANPKFDWTFLSVPQRSANNRIVLQPRGKGLGGSSLVSDSKPYIRSQRADVL